MPNNYQRIQDFAAAVEQHPTWPRAICFGDSWFQYPGPKPTHIEKQLPQIFTKTPTEAGFRRIAHDYWAPVLQRAEVRPRTPFRA